MNATTFVHLQKQPTMTKGGRKSVLVCILFIQSMAAVRKYLDHRSF